MVIIVWDFLTFDQIFLSLKMKGSVIISNKHGIFELPHEFSNNLRLRKISKIYRVIAQGSVYLTNNFFSNARKKLPKNRNWTFPVVFYFSWKLKFISNISSMIAGMKLIRMNLGVKLIFCVWLGIHKYIYLIQSIHIDVVRHTKAFQK